MSVHKRHPMLITIAKGLIKECKKQDIMVDCWSIKSDSGKTGIATLDCDIAIDVNIVPDKLPIAFIVDHVEYDATLFRLKFIIKDED